MREEADFLERLYRDLRFNRATSGDVVLNRLYARHRLLWAKDRYGYEVSLSINAVIEAELAREPEIDEDQLESKILTALSKIPRLGEKERTRSSFQKRKRAGPRQH
ncbi:hypothetical protein J8273_5924 [Carpediemonas membranifera]|nr:hypothetical protein J8273_5924 [Carpediemonas membranifera]|eukprot:KAG9392780.1 hypothetical protein J8273_5924 [Carpediemonas membranifera]